MCIAADAGLFAIPVLAHHGGLPDSAEWIPRLAEARARGDLDEAAALMPDIIEQARRLGVSEPEFTRHDPLALEMYVRMLFSCLVDADSRDTESHLRRSRATRRRQADDIQTLADSFSRYMEAKILEADDTVVNRRRGEVYAACVAAADGPPGVYTLTVPTGLGKTLGSVGFGLRHAAGRRDDRHRPERIIVAVPQTTLTEQTSGILAGILGPRNVLEHHSALAAPRSPEELARYLWMELAAEDWDSPIVVTTTVQLLNSLFSNARADCRKLHRIANSVVILDEAQSLPVGMIQPIVDVLRELVEHYGVTLVLCTATQPPLAGQTPFLSGFAGVTEIVSDPGRHFRDPGLRRVRYRVIAEPWSWERVAAEMRHREQVLCVVNSRHDARRLRHLLGGNAIHLSAHMCPAHRRRVLAQIRHRLRNHLPCRVVSTSLIEYGIDLDFPCVMRACGPLERVVQAAGRGNREGLLGEVAEVIIFTPIEERAPRGVYRVEMSIARHLLDCLESAPDDPQTIERYFQAVFSAGKESGLDAKDINRLRRAGDFRQVAAAGRLIDDDMVSVIVPYDRRVTNPILGRISARAQPGTADCRKLRQYAVRISRRQYQRCLQSGQAREIIAGLGVWEGGYSRLTGIEGLDGDPPDVEP